MRLNGKRDKPTGRTGGQPYMTRSQTARRAAVSMARAVEPANFSECRHNSGGIEQEQLDRPRPLRKGRAGGIPATCKGNIRSRISRGL